MSKVEKARQSWDIEIDRSKRDGIARTASSRRCVWRYIQKKKKKKRERKWKRKKEKWRKEGKMLERRVIGGTGWIPFGVVRSKFDWRTNRRHWRRNIRKLERPGEAGTQPRIGQWPTIGSHPIFACQFRGRYCAVDNAPIITLNGDHSYAHSAGFKPPFRIHYRRAAQIIAPMRAASSFFFFFRPFLPPRPAGGIDYRSVGSSTFHLAFSLAKITTRFVRRHRVSGCVISSRHFVSHLFPL